MFLYEHDARNPILGREPYPYEFFSNNRWYSHFQKFHKFISDEYDRYPKPLDNERLELELAMPSERPETIPFHWNPHMVSYSSHTPFFSSADWSTVLGPYPTWSRNGWDDSLGVYITIEEGHKDPVWGDRVELYSTSQSFADHHSNRYCKFRNKYWKVLNKPSEDITNHFPFLYPEPESMLFTLI